jgi:hypothetical protein
VGLLLVVAVVGPRHVVVAELVVRRSSGKHPADLDGAVRQDLAFVVPSKFKEPLQLRVARWYIFKPKNQIWGKF